MACAHCMRGDAQNIDLATEHIDALLDQTKQIKMLRFTGGEPTVNIDGMRYFLDGCIKRDIKIKYLVLTINGKVTTDEMVQLLIDYDEWIEHYPSDEQFNLLKYHVMLWISKDKYHDGGIADRAFDFYSDALKAKKHIKVQLYTLTNFTIKRLGRAENLKDQFVWSKHDFPENRRIEFLNSDSKCECYCPYRKREKTPTDFDVTRVLCNVYLNATGMITPQAADASFEQNDANALYPVICSVNEPIFDYILAFNRRPVILCADKHLPPVSLTRAIIEDWALLGSMNSKENIDKMITAIKEESAEVLHPPESESSAHLSAEYREKHPSYEALLQLYQQFPFLYLNEIETYLRCVQNMNNPKDQISRIASDTINTLRQLNDIRKNECNDIQTEAQYALKFLLATLQKRKKGS